MIMIFTNLFIAFGWICFLGLSALLLWILNEHNYWMPPILITWSIITLVMMWITDYISVGLFG